jgi:hypothetical protein
MYATSHVNPSENPSGTGFTYQFSIAETLGRGGAVPHTSPTLADLSARFASVRIQAETISLMENRLRSGRAFSLPCVDFTHDDLRKLGF